MEFLEETVRKDPDVSWAKFVAKIRMKSTNFERKIKRESNILTE